MTINHVLPVRSIIPIFWTRGVVWRSITPEVSKPSGTKTHLSDRDAYLARLQSSTSRAADPVSRADVTKLLLEYVS